MGFFDKEKLTEIANKAKEKLKIGFPLSISISFIASSFVLNLNGIS